MRGGRAFFGAGCVRITLRVSLIHARSLQTSREICSGVCRRKLSQKLKHYLCTGMHPYLAVRLERTALYWRSLGLQSWSPKDVCHGLPALRERLQPLSNLVRWQRPSMVRHGACPLKPQLCSRNPAPQTSALLDIAKAVVP